MYEITIDRSFAASHALRLPDDTLEPVHGHDWPVTVTVAADRLDAMQTVMDFHELEPLVDAAIKPWHNRHLNDCPPFDTGEINPSAERVAEHIARHVAAGLPEHVTLTSVTVGEAPGCKATYRADVS